MNVELHKQLTAACEMYVMMQKYDNAIKQLKQEKANVQQRYDQMKKDGIKIGKGMTWSIVLSALICTVIMFVSIISALNRFNPESNEITALISVISPFSLVVVPVFVGILYKKIVGKSKENAFKKKMAKYYQNEYSPARDKLSANISSLNSERHRFWITNQHVLEFIPEHYRTNLAVAFMEHVVRTGRADTMKEALNLFEEQLHRWDMENHARRLEEQAALERAMLEEHMRCIEAKQGRIASTLQSIENLEFYNTFCR